MSNEKLELDEWLQSNFSLLGKRVPKRYILTLSIVLLIKSVSAYSVFQYLNMDQDQPYWADSSRVESLEQNLVLTKNVDTYPRFTYLFLGWDSAWYLSILTHGYKFSDQSFAFFPGFIYIASLIDLIVKNSLFTMLLITVISGFLSISVFQSILEFYTNKTYAFYYTLIFAFSPYIFIFSTVVYAEGLFLVTTLASWWLCLKGRYTFSAILASISAFIRPPGALLALPIFLKSIKSLTFKNLIRKSYLIILPFTGYLGAWINAWIISGDSLAIIRVNEWNGMYTPLVFFSNVLPSYGLEAFSFPLQSLDLHILLPISIFISLIFPLKIIYDLLKLDLTLSIYSSIYYLGALLMGSMLSLPRYMFFLFPLWIRPINIENRYGKQCFILLLLISIAVSFYLWVGFLNGLFIG